MAQDQNHLIWLDMEMTGLNPDSDRIIEMAMVVTNSKLEVIAEGPVIAVHQPDAVLEGMDEWNKNTHGRSGLIERVKASTIDEAAAEALYLDFMREYIPSRASPSIMPHSGVGGCTPSPKKDRAETISITAPVSSVARTLISPAAQGSR